MRVGRRGITLSVVTKKIDYETICKLWKNLWPDRDPPETSAMMFPEGYSQKAKQNPPTHWGLFVDDELVGVNSGHKTSDTHYRSRGIWVEPDHRNKGYSSLLFECVFDQAFEEGCEYVWSCPKKEAAVIYTNNGFEIVSDWIELDYGSNAYAIIKIV